MRDAANIQALSALGPDYMGFIFYEKSKRYVKSLDLSVLDTLPTSIKKVGVFVNADFETIVEKIEAYGLDLVQLHGKETPELCERLKTRGTGVIKVFSVGDDFDFSEIEPYKAHSDYFLFDTKGKDYGGNGVVFNWEVLKKYDNEIPFFISGGLSTENINDIEELEGMNLAAVDLNSCFETEPAMKDISLLESINFEELRTKFPTHGSSV